MSPKHLLDKSCKITTIWHASTELLASLNLPGKKKKKFTDNFLKQQTPENTGQLLKNNYRCVIICVMVQTCDVNLS